MEQTRKIGYDIRSEMKQCPQCKRTYSDETLSFCLADGELLSAPYEPGDPEEATLISTGEIATVVAAFETQGAEPAGRVRWYVYLLGFVVSLIAYVLMLTMLTREVLDDLSHEPLARALESVTGITSGMYYVAELVTRIVLVGSWFGIVAFLFALVWPNGRWKWGLIMVLPALLADILPVFRYAAFLVSNPGDLDTYIAAHFVGEIGFFLVVGVIACLCAMLGAGLSNRSRRPVVS